MAGIVVQPSPYFRAAVMSPAVDKSNPPSNGPWDKRRERTRGHGRTEIRAANADVHDIGKARAGRGLDLPSRTAAAKASILARSARTSGMTSWPSANIGRPKLRKAMCRAGRCSVVFTGSPAKSAARRASTPAARARSTSSPIVVSFMRCLEIEQEAVSST